MFEFIGWIVVTVLSLGPLALAGVMIKDSFGDYGSLSGWELLFMFGCIAVGSVGLMFSWDHKPFMLDFFVTVSAA